MKYDTLIGTVLSNTSKNKSIFII